MVVCYNGSMKQIIWKNIKLYKGYQVNNIGEVRSIDRFITQRARPSIGGTFKRLYLGRVLKLDVGKNGYVRVMLNKGKRELVHRLVAKEFILNLEKKPCTNHLDNNRGNNKVENLEWVTHSENLLYCVKQGRQSVVRAVGEDCGGARLTEKQVKQIRKLKGKMSYRKIGRKFGVVHSTVKNIIVRNNWKHI